MLPQPHISQRWGLMRISHGASGAWLLIVVACYVARWDFCAGMTVLPAWCWAIPGLLLAIFTRTVRGNAPWLLPACWLAALLLLADHPAAWLRRATKEHSSTPNQSSKYLRVVTFNCANLGLTAAREVATLHPDIVLLQEAPGPEDLARLSSELFGDQGNWLSGGDCAIVARGQVAASKFIPSNAARHFVAADITVPSDVHILVVSARLSPQTARLDYWSPDCWHSYRQSRLRHHSEIRELADLLQALPHDSCPLRLLGGDFNAPAGDAIFRRLQALFLYDTFAVAGAGWGNTFLNDWPVLRLDQIWANSGFVCTCCRAVPSLHSDHRLVVCDLNLNK